MTEKPILTYKRWNRVFESNAPDVFYFKIYDSAIEPDFSDKFTEIVKQKLEREYSSEVNIDSVKLIEGKVIPEPKLEIIFSMQESELDLFSTIGAVAPIKLELRLASNPLTNTNLISTLKKYSSNQIKSIDEKSSNAYKKQFGYVIFKVDPSLYSGDPVQTLIDSLDITKISLSFIHTPYMLHTSRSYSEEFLELLSDTFSETGSELESRRHFLAKKLAENINKDNNIAKECIRLFLSKIKIDVIPKNLKEFEGSVVSKFNSAEDLIVSAFGEKEKEDAIISLLDLEIELGQYMRDGFIEHSVASDYIMRIYSAFDENDISNDRLEELVKNSKYYTGI